MLVPVQRNQNGTFIKGVTYPEQSHGAQIYRYSARAQMLEQQMTAQEILALADDDEALGKRPAIDMIVVRRLARAMQNVKAVTCADVERAAEAHLDRVEGKPSQPIEQKDQGDVLERAKALLRDGLATAKLLELCKAAGVDVGQYDVQIIEQ